MVRTFRSRVILEQACAKKDSLKYNLNRHLLVQTKNKLFTFEVSNKEFPQISQINKLECVHTQKVSFICLEWNKENFLWHLLLTFFLFILKRSRSQVKFATRDILKNCTLNVHLHVYINKKSFQL